MDEQHEITDFEGGEKLRNATWQSNHREITEAMRMLILKYERLPSNAELARETGISIPTIYKHLNEFDGGVFMEDEMQRFKLMLEDVLGVVLAKSIMGDVRSLRLALRLMGAWGKGKAPDAKGL